MCFWFEIQIDWTKIIEQMNNWARPGYLVGQQQIPDFSQILLGEDKANVAFNVRQKPVESQK